MKHLLIILLALFCGAFSLSGTIMFCLEKDFKFRHMLLWSASTVAFAILTGELIFT